MKADCKGRGSAPSSHHLSPSLLEKNSTPRNAVAEYISSYASSSTLYSTPLSRSFEACELVYMFSHIHQSIARISDAVPCHYLSKCHNECWIVVLNGKNCNQCHRGYKSQGSLFVNVLLMPSSLSTRDLWPLRHLTRVMRRLVLTNQETKTKMRPFRKQPSKRGWR